MSNILGVYARFQVEDTGSETKNEKEFKGFLWGNDGDGGLSSELKKVSGSYGKDLKLILIQFIVNSISSPFPNPDPLGKFRQKEKSIGVWIEINKENFFNKSEKDRNTYVKSEILDHLEKLNKRFRAKSWILIWSNSSRT